MFHLDSTKMEILSRFCLEDRVAVITGAGSGIGQGIALGFAGVGAHIVVADLEATRAENTAVMIRDLDRKARPIALDVTDSEQVQKMVDKVINEFGKIDILVNNVGGTTRGMILDMDEDVWDSVIKLNLKSTFLCSKAVGKVMREQKRGNIINIASTTSMRACPGGAPYGAAKAGIVHFTQSLALSMAPYNIRVNSIAPGVTDTPGTSHMGTSQQRAEKEAIPLGRIGKPEDMAFAAIYLASDASDFVTGIVLPVNGGPYLGGITLKQAEASWGIK